MTIRSWAMMTRALQRDRELRDAFTAALAEQPHDAFAWETAPVSAATRDRPYAEAVIASRELARVTADPSPFSAQFAASADDICTFANLGGDTVLIAPAPRASAEVYAHLACFVRGAPADQVAALWIAVGRAVEHHWATSDAPVWVSTAGLGVHWLHVRLDSRPKYYRHQPFRSFP